MSVEFAKLLDAIGCLNCNLFFPSFLWKILRKKVGELPINAVFRSSQLRPRIIQTSDAMSQRTSVSFHYNIVSTERTELLLLSLHKNGAPNTEDVLTLHADGPPVNRKADGAQMVIYLGDDFNNICTHLCADSFCHCFCHDGVRLDEFGKGFRGPKFRPLVKL